MREIKFRVYDEVQKQMREVELLPLPQPREQQTEPLMQYTGLFDRNGVEIFEGDIVRSTYQPMWRLGDVEGEMKAKMARREQVGVVEWDTCNPCFIINGIDFKSPEYDFICCNMRTNEIIGNIYENPELLNNNN